MIEYVYKRNNAEDLEDLPEGAKCNKCSNLLTIPFYEHIRQAGYPCDCCPYSIHSYYCCPSCTIGSFGGDDIRFIDDK